MILLYSILVHHVHMNFLLNLNLLHYVWIYCTFCLRMYKRNLVFLKKQIYMLTEIWTLILPCTPLAGSYVHIPKSCKFLMISKISEILMSNIKKCIKWWLIDVQKLYENLIYRHFIYYLIHESSDHKFNNLDMCINYMV